MPVSCHFQGCKALLRTDKRRYIKYHAFAFFDYVSNYPADRQSNKGKNITSLGEAKAINAEVQTA